MSNVTFLTASLVWRQPWLKQSAMQDSDGRLNDIYKNLFTLATLKNFQNDWLNAYLWQQRTKMSEKIKCFLRPRMTIGESPMVSVGVSKM